MNPIDWDALNSGLKRLKLRKIRDLLGKEGIREQLASYDDPIELVAHLVDEEVAARDRTQKEKRFRQARFPAAKTLQDFDFSLQPSVDEEHIRSLAQLEFVRQRENVIFVGPAGIGKTHLSIALGIEAVEAGYKVRFITAGQLVDALYSSLADGTFKRELKRYDAFDLVVIDELGYLSMDRTASDHFFEVINQAYENQSIILTTNRPFQEWAGLFDDAITVSAILDRLLHHAHLFNMKGDSYRLRQHFTQEVSTVI
jgi:DNA replication protein DnaC